MLAAIISTSPLCTQIAYELYIQCGVVDWSFVHLTLFSFKVKVSNAENNDHNWIVRGSTHSFKCHFHTFDVWWASRYSHSQYYMNTQMQFITTNGLDYEYLLLLHIYNKNSEYKICENVIKRQYAELITLSKFLVHITAYIY